MLTPEQMNYYRSIIRAPIVSEKSMEEAERLNKYHFEVMPEANKIEIRRAIEAVFSVRVVKVNTLNVKGKTRQRSYRGRAGRTARVKKAIVTLAPGEHIDLIEVA